MAFLQRFVLEPKYEFSEVFNDAICRQTRAQRIILQKCRWGLQEKYE